MQQLQANLTIAMGGGRSMNVGGFNCDTLGSCKASLILKYDFDGVGAAARPLMDAPGSDEIAAMLKREGVDYEAMPRVDHQGDPRDLLAGRADAMVAYSTNEPFVLEQLGAADRTFSPAASGIDFYGDNLCTSVFRAASVKGWAYVLAHKEATVDLIRKSYSTKKSREALPFEAEHTEMIVGRDPGRIGDQDPARWHAIAVTYRKLGFLTHDTLPKALIWDGTDGNLRLRLPSVRSIES